MVQFWYIFKCFFYLIPTTRQITLFIFDNTWHSMFYRSKGINVLKICLLFFVVINQDVLQFGGKYEANTLKFIEKSLNYYCFAQIISRLFFVLNLDLSEITEVFYSVMIVLKTYMQCIERPVHCFDIYATITSRFLRSR